MSALRQGVNRATLLCVAVLLLGSGAALATTADPVRDRLPSGWPRLGTDRVWLDGAALGRWRDHSWWPPVVIAALAVALLLFLCWVALEVRAGRLRVLPLGRDGVTLAGPALAAAMAGRVQAVDGVARAHVRLLGRPHRLRVRITLVLAADGSPRAVLRRLAEQAVAEARAAAAPRALEAEVRIGVRTHRARPRRRVR
ncbi:MULTISPECIES: alkaline shock response membrane anchor protein AmaP [Streptomyces]|uniref:Alkaline shock response membrane anchor protein AmaP n=1 Tax=Streptomyces alboflavus TaxID=67267 RepID=A0A1Z1WKG0_9ACTN|nr:alkaline shock response membrane anchor protein AmaP [Streptomyces alboflavus]ARX86926.1 hypothetical protein SMD44_06407 [Streptomyces alboflavus]